MKEDCMRTFFKSIICCIASAVIAPLASASYENQESHESDPNIYKIIFSKEHYVEKNGTTTSSIELPGGGKIQITQTAKNVKEPTTVPIATSPSIPTPLITSDSRTVSVTYGSFDSAYVNINYKIPTGYSIGILASMWKPLYDYGTLKCITPIEQCYVNITLLSSF